MARAQYIETPCKTALNRVRGMPFNWSLNPYRGCTHACHYCYARATHAYAGMNADEDFETKIVVKTNLPEVLRRELARPSWVRERVALGTATDAYQPCEGRYRLTRRALEALLERRNPVGVVTKSTLILRDLDLLAALAAVASVSVYVTVTTLDPALWRLVEPGTPPPLQRLAIVRRLNEAGVPTGVLAAPVLPAITDGAAALDALAAAAAAHGARSFGVSPLRLAPLVKEHYLRVVAAAFPDLLPRYERAFPGVNAPRAYQEALERRVARVRARHGLAARDPRPAFTAIAPSPVSPGNHGQLALGL
ncbi:MAG: Radical SAM domain protein [uncultured Thermomicrobiales bacterium]|uniref:Radical SAM domain protein n=1 Tax=uncultured Thermomicrobiales bacterium TaxID=1645740 RepID=A0A6J4V887_9BACT|nr:MAG: Radical SAM domain protein [uncultured Thermomicrobiales bacterium]